MDSRTNKALGYWPVLMAEEQIRKWFADRWEISTWKFLAMTPEKRELRKLPHSTAGASSVARTLKNRPKPCLHQKQLQKHCSDPVIDPLRVNCNNQVVTYSTLLIAA